MARRPRRSRWIALISSAVLVAACGGGGAAAPTLGPGAGSVQPGSTGGPGGGAGQPSASGIGIFPFSLPPQPTWPPVGGLARVVNIYDPLIEPPFAVDVRQQSFLTNSNPLLTVQPGTASPYFDPGDEGDGSTDLSFLRAGSTQSVDLVMEQGWAKMKGRQITMVLMTSGSTINDGSPSASPVRAGGAVYVVEERGGDNPRPSLPAGKGLLWIDTQPLNELPSGTGWVSPAIGTGDGTCLTAVNDVGGEFTFLFARSAFAFPPGPVSLFVYSPVSNQGECKGTPAYGPITANVEAGRESVAIVYGSDIKKLKTLLLPIQ